IPGADPALQTGRGAPAQSGAGGRGGAGWAPPRLMASFMQDMSDRLGAGRQGGAAQQQVRDALAAVLRVRFLEHEDSPLGNFRQTATGRTAPRLVQQASRPLGLEFTFPGVQSMLGEPDERPKIAGGQTAAPPGIEDQQT